MLYKGFICEVTFINSFFSTGRREFVQRLKLEAILKVHDGCVSIKNICRFMFCLMFPGQSSHNFFPRCKFQQVCVSLFDVIYHEGWWSPVSHTHMLWFCITKWFCRWFVLRLKSFTALHWWELKSLNSVCRWEEILLSASLKYASYSFQLKTHFSYLVQPFYSSSLWYDIVALFLNALCHAIFI